jgi:hypothetical protein
MRCASLVRGNTRNNRMILSAYYLVRAFKSFHRSAPIFDHL